MLLLEQCLHGLSGGLDVGGGNGVLVHNLLEVNINGVSGRHDVVVVQHLDERLDFASLVQLGLAHGSNDLARVSINAGNCGKTNEVGEFQLAIRNQRDPKWWRQNNDKRVLTQSVTELLGGLVALIAGLDHDSLSAGESAGQHNHNLSVLDAGET